MLFPGYFHVQFCHEAGGEAGYKVVLEQILPITAAMLEDDKLEVRASLHCIRRRRLP
jgi:hypothetical protein